MQHLKNIELEIFNKYKDIFKEYGSEFNNKVIKGESLRSFHKKLKRFDIRFRLSLGLEINFNTEISKTNHELTHQTYVLIYKTNDLWFLYEVFYKLAGDLNILTLIKKGKIIESFSSELLNCTNINNLNNKFNENLYKYFENEKRRKDLINFINSLNKDNENKYGYLIEKFDKRTAFSIEDIMTLVYRNRNNFVHTDSMGMTALTGVENYRTKIKILQYSYDYLLGSLYECINFIIVKQIEKIRTEN